MPNSSMTLRPPWLCSRGPGLDVGPARWGPAHSTWNWPIHNQTTWSSRSMIPLAAGPLRVGGPTVNRTATVLRPVTLGASVKLEPISHRCVISP